MKTACKPTYSEKLKHPRWQKLRLEVMQRDDFSCVDCGDKNNMLAVHHSYYVTGRNPWMYPIWSLTTLCSDCHKERHDAMKEKSEMDDAGEEYQGESWEIMPGLLGMKSAEDIDEWWDIAAFIGARMEYFTTGAKSWVMQAVLARFNQDQLELGVSK